MTSRTKTSSRLAAAVLAGSLAITVSACGGDDDVDEVENEVEDEMDEVEDELDEVEDDIQEEIGG